MTCEGYSFKGQSSVEFLLVVGIALSISTPFLLAAQQSVIDLEQTSRSVSLEQSLDKLEQAVKTVSVSGEPARRTFNMDIPDNVLKAQVVQGRGVVYTVRNGGGVFNSSRLFETNISMPEGLPEDPGRSKVSVYAWNGQVNISRPGFNSTESSTERPLNLIFYSGDNGNLNYYNIDNDSIEQVTDEYDVEALGPQSSNLDGDDRYEIVFGADGKLYITDYTGEVRNLAENNKYQETKYGIGGDSSDAIYYPGDPNNGYDIYRVSVDSRASLVSRIGDGVSAISDVDDFDGDGNEEIIFVGGSQVIQYLNEDGSVVSTGRQVGSNNGLGLGASYDFNGNGRSRVAIVDNSNNIALVNNQGEKELLTEDGEASKTSISVIDLDDDGDMEIAYVPKSGDRGIYYVDDILGQNQIAELSSEAKPATEVGLTGRIR